MDPADAPRPERVREVLGSLSGRYGVHPDVEPAAAALPPAVRWLLGGLLAVVVLGGLAWALVADGSSLAGAVLPSGGLTGLPWEALLVVGGGYLVVRWVRAGEPHTVLDAHALAVVRGRSRREVPWEQVVAVVPAPRYRWWPTAVLTDGTRQELPGVPAEVGERLAELFVAPPGQRPGPQAGRGRTQQPPPSTPRDDDGGWDGPFRTGGSA